MSACRLLVQDLSDESLLGTETVLEGRATERHRRHRRCPAQETPRTFTVQGWKNLGFLRKSF